MWEAKRELISSNSKVHFLSLWLSVKNIIWHYNCLLLLFLSFLIYNLLLLLQLQKATTETNRTKEDMKALQNDLSNTDKEITVRNYVLSTYYTLSICLCCFQLKCLSLKATNPIYGGFYRGFCSFNIHLDYTMFYFNSFWQLTVFSELWSDWKSFFAERIFSMLTKWSKTFLCFLDVYAN